MKDLKKKTSALLKIVAFLYVPMLICAVIIMAYSFFMKEQPNPAITLSISILWAPFFLYYYKKHRPETIIPRNALSFKYLVAAMLLGVVWHLTTYLLEPFNPLPNVSHITSIYVWILLFVETVLFAPVLEELFFRQWVPSYMSKYGFSYKSRLIVSSFLFYSVHWQAVVLPHWYYRIDTLVVGALLYVFYTHTKDIRYCIIAHSISNAILLIFEHSLTEIVF